jgi:hypothetical protein
MATFPIHRVDSDRSEAVEQLGSKPKFWFREGQTRYLFKAEARNSGEDWAEVIASQLCQLLGLPHVEYELAAEYRDGQYFRPGVVCASMAPPPISLVLGNQFLTILDSTYPMQQRFKVPQHTVDAVARVLRLLQLPSDRWLSGMPKGIESATDVFIGYILLDAWIANQDRHHENWGALWESGKMRLAPTFDHGAAMARNLSDDERSRRLATSDERFTVTAFANRATSKFFRMAENTQPLRTVEAYSAFAELRPKAAEIWLCQLAGVNKASIWGIIESVPPDRMSQVCRTFTLEILLCNQQRLLQTRT